MLSSFNQTIDHKPYLAQFLYLVFFFFGCLSFTLLLSGLLLTVLGLKLDFMKYADYDNLKSVELAALKLNQIVSSLGMFILPALLFAYFKKGNWTTYFGANQPVRVLPALLAIGITFASLPIVGLLLQFNQSLVLPEALRSLEIYIQQTEEQAMQLTNVFLQMDTLADLFFNLLMIAILPAVGEELFFRGALQQLFREWSKRPHLAIFLSAFIFSFIHFQFYGFLPRLALGMFFGYLLYWSGNIWYPIIGHFVHNGSQVLMVYFLDIDISEMDAQQTEHLSLYTIIGGTVILGGFSYYYYKLFRPKEA